MNFPDNEDTGTVNLHKTTKLRLPEFLWFMKKEVDSEKKDV